MYTLGVYHLAHTELPREHTRMGTNIYICLCGVAEYCASQNATLEANQNFRSSRNPINSNYQTQLIKAKHKSRIKKKALALYAMIAQVSVIGLHFMTIICVTNEVAYLLNNYGKSSSLQL